MKFNYKSNIILLVATFFGVTACQDVEMPNPNLTTTTTSSKAFFAMANTSIGAPSLDLYINNLKLGTSVGNNSSQSTYTMSPITSNGVLSGNTNIRAKATTGTIGGVLDKSDAIFRSASNGTNNFTAADSGYYTVIAIDSINRPKPLRTYNAGNFGDITYYTTETAFTAPKMDGVGDTTIVLTTNNSIVTYNLVKKYNGGVAPSFFVPLGTVPLGSTDPGGIRFLVVTDQLPLPSGTRFPKPAAGKCAVRFIHASPNTEDVTVTVGGTSVTNGYFTNQMKYPTFATAAIGSRTVTQSSYKTLNAGAMDIVVSGTAAAKVAEQLGYTFEEKGVYTIVMSGDRNDVTGGNLLVLSIIKNK